MSEYTVQTGDTFDLISRKVYGVETNATALAAANPGLYEPLTAGVSIITPPQAGAPQDKPPSTPFTDENEVTIAINNKVFRFWTTFNVLQQLDGMSTFTFNAPLTPDDPDFRASFAPFQYQDIQISVGADRLFTGTLISVQPDVTAEAKVVTVSGYSRPGVINDCTPFAPDDSYQLEFNNANIVDIAQGIMQPFGIRAIGGAGAPGAIFERVAIQPDGNILNFFTTLAQQRGLVIASDPFGSLLFRRAESEGPIVVTLAEGSIPLLSVAPQFNQQGYFSHVSGIEPVYAGTRGSSFTVKNERLKTATRPHTFIVRDAETGEVEEAVKAKAGRMFANVVAYTVTLNTWRDPSGALWAPNTLIDLTAPGAMIFEEYTFLIRTVSFNKSAASETATLNLIIPGSFSGEIPETLPWD